MSDRQQAARRLSALAKSVYGGMAAGGGGAWVEWRAGSYRLHEPGPNSWPIEYKTARECREAIEASARQFAADAGYDRSK